MRNLYLGQDVLAVLPTGFGKSRIYQAFSLLKSCENTGATLIIEDQLADLIINNLINFYKETQLNVTLVIDFISVGGS